MSTSFCSPAPLIAAPASRRPSLSLLPLAAISGRTAIWSVLLGVGLITPLAVGIGVLHLPESAGATAAAQQRWLGYLHHPGALWLKAVLVYPILEEIFYRGLLLQLLRRYCPLWLAITLPTVLFGLTHLGHGYGNALNALLLGGVFAWLVVRTRSLLPSILCHAAINFSWLFLINPAFGVLEKLVELDTARPTSLPHPLTLYPAWWVLNSVILVIAAAVMLRKSVPRSTGA